MNKKRFVSIVAAAAILLPSLLTLTGCGSKQAEIVLKVYNWEEYIDDGGEGSYVYDMMLEDGENPSESDAPSIIEDFEEWYEETYGISIRVDYSTFGTNEDMYNELVLGNEYDLLCPSDYMIMKLAAEDRIEPYSDEFFDPEIEENYYVNNVSPYIQSVFESGTVAVKTEDGETEEHSWSEYAAGYMWGTTGFVYNADKVDADELAELGWAAFTSEKYTNKITAKDNVRDTYFAALGLTYQKELLDAIGNGDFAKVTEIFNRTTEKDKDGNYLYLPAVRDTLLSMKKNIYGFETDTGKSDMISGKIWLNYAWSGDAVYALDEMDALNETKAEKDQVNLNYYVPEAGSNLWFDGWVMTKGIEERGKKHAAEAFVNFLSNPENAVRNSYYIGYTSVIAGEEMLEYAEYLYGVDDEEDETEENYYDLSYFFYTKEEIEAGLCAGIYAYEDQRLSRQLYAQYPTEEVIERCAVMNYFPPETNKIINELWAQVKAEMLDAWAISVICVSVVVIVLFVLFVKFGSKIDFFRAKPKKGYTLVKQEDVKD